MSLKLCPLKNRANFVPSSPQREVTNSNKTTFFVTINSFQYESKVDTPIATVILLSTTIFLDTRLRSHYPNHHEKLLGVSHES